MAIKRITLSVPEELAAKIKSAAGDKPVSAWVTQKLEADLNEAELERQWIEWYNGLEVDANTKARAKQAIDRLHGRVSNEPQEQLAA